jgi:hypothetical protein
MQESFSLPPGAIPAIMVKTKGAAYGDPKDNNGRTGRGDGIVCRSATIYGGYG